MKTNAATDQAANKIWVLARVLVELAQEFQPVPSGILFVAVHEFMDHTTYKAITEWLQDNQVLMINNHQITVDLGMAKYHKLITQENAMPRAEDSVLFGPKTGRGFAFEASGEHPDICKNCGQHRSDHQHTSIPGRGGLCPKHSDDSRR